MLAISDGMKNGKRNKLMLKQSQLANMRVREIASLNWSFVLYREQMPNANTVALRNFLCRNGVDGTTCGGFRDGTDGGRVHRRNASFGPSERLHAN